MASVTEEPQPIPPPQRAQRAEEPLVDRQIRRTRRAIKLVDLTAGLITLAIGVLVFLLTMAVLEHWVIPGGWSETARALLFGTLILGVAGYSWRTFWPLVGQSINPVYAALAIEQHSPSLKNSLLNLLLLRNRKRYLSRQVYQAIEQQAAQRLSQVSLESAVDRSAILRLGYILVAITALCALYRFLSPKDLFTSAGRVLMPWSSMVTPSRVQILNVTPGDTKAARGAQISIAAEVLGLEEDEPVRLFYSTVDEQIVAAEVPMSASAGGAEFQCRLPARGGSGRGIQQDFVYWIEAGDARSPRYEVAVFARPTLVVSQLRYDYPAYTGYESRDVEHTGDIRALEGTQVTLIAQANKPIKTAHVDFEADGRRDLMMSTTDQEATVTFPLTLREDRRTPRYQSYVLRYVTTAGHQNEQPPKYQIDVQPDYAPEIELLLPAEAVLEVALNQEVEFELEARDPDFALSQVLLIGKVGKAEVLQEALLAGNQSGRFNGKLRKTPQAMGLKVGDVLEYWGAAADNRRPEANIAYSAHRKLRVIDPWQGNQEGEKNQGDDEQQQPGEGGEPPAGEGGQEGQAGGGEQGSAGEGEAGAEGEAGSGQQEGEAGEQQQQGPGSGGSSSDGANEGEPADSGESEGNAGGESAANESDNGRSQQEAGEGADDSTAGGQPDGEGSEQGKVSAEGDDDGSAFERMAEHFNEQDGDQGQTEKGAGGEAADNENPTKPDGEAAENSPATKQPGDPTGDESGNQAADGQSGDGTDAERAGTDAERAGTDAERAGNEAERAANEAAGKAAAEPDQEATDAAAGEKQAPSAAEKPDGQQQPAGESPNGEGSPEQGEAGGGEDQGAPKPEGDTSPHDQQGDSTDATEQGNNTDATEQGNNTDATEQGSNKAPPQGRDQGEQESEGGQSGDRSGDGKEGAGQQAEQDGKGGAGENQPADEGAGQASETGEGETGEQPGGQEKSAGETGESSGDQPGEGSDQGEQAGDKRGGESPSGQAQGEAGAEPGEGQPEENSAEPTNEQRPPQDQQQPQDQQAPPGESNPAAAEGQAGQPNGTGGNPSAPPPGGETQPGDDANLEYAREQTDLILDRLDDQLKRQEVDKSLLEKLGWSQDELRRFVDRWKNLKMQAADNKSSTDSQEQLSDALRSLGLGRNQRAGFNSQVSKDQLRDLQDSFRGRVPLEFQEQVRSYVKGTTASQENE